MGCTKSKAMEQQFKNSQFHQVELSMLKTGDLVLFGDNKTGTTKLTHLFSQCAWTHVGVVIYSPGLYPTHGPLLLEYAREHTDHLLDVSTATIVQAGTRLVDLDARLRKSTSDQIAFCKLQLPEQWRADPELVELKAQQVVADSTMRPLERKPTPLVFSGETYTALQRNLPSVSNSADLVVFALQQLEVFANNKPTDLSVGEFSSPTRVQGYLARGIGYAAPQPLKTTTLTTIRPTL